MQHAKYKLVSIIIFIVALNISLSSQAAIQMDGYMDFILDNGRTIRVFPEALEQGPIKPGNIQQNRQKVNTKPPGGDPCLKLEKTYNERIGKREKIKKAKKDRKPYKPSWLKPNRKLKNTNFLSTAFNKYQPKGWYYLPAEPRIAEKNGIPEATFVKFITDETTEAGGAEGGLFHIMVTYGLTKDEQEELSAALKEVIPNAQLKGMVDLVPSKAENNFVVTSGTLSDGQFAPNGVLTSGRAPSFPGAKAALAGRLSSLGAQLMDASFENTTSDLSVTFNYDYIVKSPAFKGEVRIDMDKIQEVKDCALQMRDKSVDKKTTFDLKRGFAGSLIGMPWLGLGSKTTTTVRQQDMEQGFDTMIDLGAVEIVFDQQLPDAEVSEIQSSLMTTAMAAFTNMQQSFATGNEVKNKRESDASEADKEAAKIRARDMQNSDKYTYYKVKDKQTRQTGVLTFKVKSSIALYRTHSMTGNIGGFIREHKDEIYDEVILNDPFFKRGVITVDLDTDALDLFEAKMINNAAVEVIVPFPEDPYTNSSVFTRADVSSGGILKKFTYAKRGENLTGTSCPYKYIESWSLRGGGKWPKNPKEKCAKEMAVTLVPPIESRRIDVEADLAEMEELGIRGVDVVFRYKQYGKSKNTSSKFRLAKGEAYNEETLYVDKESNGVAYKIILTHKDKGVFSTEWDELEADFVFANLSGLPLSKLEEISEKIPEVQSIIDELKAAF